MLITLDIETNTSHDTIWIVVTQDVETGEMLEHYSVETLEPLLRDSECVIGHNIIGFDAPVLEKQWSLKIPTEKLKDTLVLSRLWHPSLEGGHSLDSWGKRFGDHKIDFHDYDAGLSDEMVEYCRQDVALTTRLYKHLTDTLKREEFKQQCVDLEEKVYIITAEQERNGFMLDVEAATTLWQDITHKMRTITAELQKVFPPIVEERWSEKTGKRLKDKVTEFNVGSRKQIAERLEGVGVKFKQKTEKGAIIVNEKVLEGIDIPEAKAIYEYLLLQKRAAQIDSWLSSEKNGRVHGRVITNGAVTGRMTHHSPNMAQVPSVSAPYGKECRSFWTVPENHKLVGCDASGLELRMLAHYMRDENYTNEILSGDIHTANMKAAGLTDRNQAKTFIYAFLYGAGPAKIGQIVGGGYKEGQQLTDSFLRNTPALARLRERVSKFARGGTLPGLDGRRLRVRSEHAALNTLLQGAGAIVMKQALVLLSESLKKYDIPHKLVANVHDEFQIEVPENFADVVGKAAVRAIKNAGKELDLRCPLDAEYNVGNNWAETH
jgi:DNA polymerase I-like protein with 3'-5' exonuclease and polymerase domains